MSELVRVMATLRSPEGCPWDREQTHRSLRFHAVEEVYELLDAIDANDDEEMAEELGDLLLQIVFHCQLASERGAFDLNDVCRLLVEKLIRRHPHVFGEAKAGTVDAVWAQWESIKKAEKHDTRRARHSALDGVPKRLPSLLRAEKLVKKARKAGLLPPDEPDSRPAFAREAGTRRRFAAHLFELVQWAQEKGWSAEELLREELQRRERDWRRAEKAGNSRQARPKGA